MQSDREFDAGQFVRGRPPFRKQGQVTEGALSM